MVDGTGRGVDGATISVDGRRRSVTDKNGYYKLDQVCCCLGAYLLHIS